MTSDGPKIDMAAQYQARVVQVRRLRALVARLEWAGGDGCCPICGRGEHEAGCELAAVLAN